MAGLALTLDDEALDRLADELAERVAVRVAAKINPSAVTGWMDAKRAASYAGCSVNALHKAMADRAVRFSQDSPGGKAWFKAEWIDEWRGASSASRISKCRISTGGISRPFAA